MLYNLQLCPFDSRVKTPRPRPRSSLDFPLRLMHLLTARPQKETWEIEKELCLVLVVLKPLILAVPIDGGCG